MIQNTLLLFVCQSCNISSARGGSCTIYRLVCLISYPFIVASLFDLDIVHVCQGVSLSRVMGTEII